MSKISIRKRQQEYIPPNTPSYPNFQGHGLIKPILYECPGEVNFGGGNIENWDLFVVPKDIKITGFREGLFQQLIDDEIGTDFNFGELGIVVSKYDSNFPYRARFNLEDASSIANENNEEVKHKPEFVDFSRPGIYPDNLTLNVIGGDVTKTVTTSTTTTTIIPGTPGTPSRIIPGQPGFPGTPDRKEIVRTPLWVTYYEDIFLNKTTTIIIEGSTLSSTGTNLADQVSGDISQPNVIRSLGSTSVLNVNHPATSINSAINNLSRIFRGASIPTLNSSILNLYNENTRENRLTARIITWYDTAISHVYAVRAIDWFIRDIRHNFLAHQSVYQVLKINTTERIIPGLPPTPGTPDRVIPGTEGKPPQTITTTNPVTRTFQERIFFALNTYSGDTKHNKTAWRLPAEEILQSQLFDIPSSPFIDSIGVEIAPYYKLLKSYDTNLPRQFTNIAENAYLIKRGSAPQDFFVFARGDLISIPSNTTISYVDEEKLHSYLSYPQTNWDGTFKEERTRCPSWILYWVLTDEIFGLEIDENLINKESFYKVSQYNNELVDGFPRWMFDGELNGSIRDIIETLLTSMNAILYQNYQGKWELSQETPTETKWLVGPNTVTESKITYRTSTNKPRIKSPFLNRLTGKTEEARSTLSSTTDIERKYPGQEKTCAIRWVEWQSFIEQNLLESIEFSIPMRITNNELLLSDFQKLELFDIIEIYDPLIAGQRCCGRVIESSNTHIKLDNIPEDLFFGGRVNEDDLLEIIPPETTKLKLQKPNGGIETISINKVVFDHNDNSINRVEFDEREKPLIGSVWALQHQNLYPRKYRVLSIAEGKDGLLYQITARPYYDGMSEHIENGDDLVIPPWVWINNINCGVNVNQFLGLASNVHQNYSVKYDSIVDIKLDEWNIEFDSMLGLVSNLDNSCDLPEN